MIVIDREHLKNWFRVLMLYFVKIDLSRPITKLMDVVKLTEPM